MPAETLRVEVILALADGAQRVVLEVLPGRSVGDVVRQSGLAEAPGAPPELEGHVGCWGQHRQLTDPVEEGDRIELYRDLTVDPMLARRRRAARKARGG